MAKETKNNSHLLVAIVAICAVVAMFGMVLSGSNSIMPERSNAATHNTDQTLTGEALRGITAKGGQESFATLEYEFTRYGPGYGDRTSMTKVTYDSEITSTTQFYCFPSSSYGNIIDSFTETSLTEQPSSIRVQSGGLDLANGFQCATLVGGPTGVELANLNMASGSIPVVRNLRVTEVDGRTVYGALEVYGNDVDLRTISPKVWVRNAADQSYTLADVSITSANLAEFRAIISPNAEAVDVSTKWESTSTEGGLSGVDMQVKYRAVDYLYYDRIRGPGTNLARALTAESNFE